MLYSSGTTGRPKGVKRALTGGPLAQPNPLLMLAKMLYQFDENTVWGQLTVLELKLLINLALQNFEAAHELVGAFLQYNENTVDRGLFYQAMNVVLTVLLDDELELADYETNFRRMFGDPRMDAVLGSVDGRVRFYGLTPTSMKLEGLDRHQRLVDSYKKFHMARGKAAALPN